MNFRILSIGVVVPGLFWFCVAYPPLVGAYLLFESDRCPPGVKWGVKNPVKVLFHRDSFDEYARNAGVVDVSTTQRLALEDIKSIIEVFNSVNGTTLELEYAGNITGDRDLGDPDDEKFAKRGIVVGFTKDKHGSSPNAEAWSASPADNDCTINRRHLRFHYNADAKAGKLVTWTFGPPTDTDAPVRGAGGVTSFRAILAHEMGHAIGLDHPAGDYAIMAQGMKTWVRGTDEGGRIQLLPDDVRGVLALYGPGGDPDVLDVSVTNTGVLVSSQLTDRKIDDYLDGERRDCPQEEAAVINLENIIAMADRDLATLTAKARKNMKTWLTESKTRLAALELDLQLCQTTAENAVQARLCKVSSRADDWADPVAEAVLCGVNKGSKYPKAAQQVCPGTQIMMRYTLNNHGLFQDVLVNTEVRFSDDTKLEVGGWGDPKSADSREVNLPAGTSKSVGHVYRLPSELGEGRTYRVFVRALPSDPRTGSSLWHTDSDIWNNAIMQPWTITVTRSACS